MIKKGILQKNTLGNIKNKRERPRAKLSRPFMQLSAPFSYVGIISYLRYKVNIKNIKGCDFY